MLAPRTHRILLSLALLSTAVCGQRGNQRDQRDQPQGWPAMPAETGELGTIYPQPSDVIVDDTLVHQDETGGIDQTLEALVGGPAGYAAVWIDGRDGNRGLYAGRLGAGGRRTVAEQPVNPPVTTRQFHPAIAMSPAGNGGVVWFFTRFGVEGEHVRFFADDGTFAKGISPVASSPAPAGEERGPAAGRGAAPRDSGGRNGAAGGAGRGGGAQLDPALAYGADGKGLVAWAPGGRVTVRPFLWADRGQRLTQGEVLLDEKGPRATSGLRIISVPGGGFAAAWNVDGGIQRWRGAADGRGKVLGVVPGALLDLAPTADGATMLVQEKDRVLIRDVFTGAGGPVLTQGVYDSGKLAAWSQGIVIVLERVAGGRGRDARTEGLCVRIDPDGQVEAEPLAPLLGGGAVPGGGTRVASMGPEASEYLLAWTERREGNEDVYFRLFGTDGPSTAPMRWNTDVGSARQHYVNIASNGNEAVIVWQDGRNAGDDHVFARRIGSDGGFAGDEFQMGLRPRGDGDAGGEFDSSAPEQRMPAVAVAANGGFLAVWKEQRSAGWRLVAQRFAADNRPAGAPFALDPDGDASLAWPSAVIALGGGRGYAVAWVRGASQVAVARLPLEEGRIPTPIALPGAPGSRVHRPALAELDDGRVFLAWDEQQTDRKPRLRGRFLSRDLAPEGQEVSFGPSPWGNGDLDPSLAPTAGGGFIMAWTANEGPTRDVYARVFDGRGSAVTAPIQVSVKNNEQDFPEICRLADGSFFVVWEDDISYRDHIHAARIDPETWTLGPRVTLNQREAAFNETRTLGVAAPLGEGIATAWIDIRRSLGQDVYTRVIGNSFDVFRR